MRKTELRELYKMMFPDYPDIVTVAQLQKMLGISRHLAYDLINDGYICSTKVQFMKSCRRKNQISRSKSS